MQEKKVTLRYRIIKWFVRLFYKKYKVVGLENLPDEPCIIVGNHCQLHGPLACELYFPADKYIWCAGQMMHLKEVPAYAFEDFWSQKPKRSQWYYKICSYLIAPLCAQEHSQVFALQNADALLQVHQSTPSTRDPA
jgi:hypothetical protein